MTGGLASPPDSRYNSPLGADGSSSISSKLHCEKLSPPKFVNPRDLQDPMESHEDEFEQLELVNLTEQGASSQGDVESDFTTRSRKSSLTSSLSDVAENEDGRDPATPIEPKKPLSHSSDDEGDDPMPSQSDLSVEGVNDALIEVESNELLLDSTELEERVEEMVLVESNNPESDSSDNDKRDDPMVGVESEEPLSDSGESEDDPIIAVESKEPSNLMEDDEEGDLTPGVNSTQLLDLSDDEPLPIIGIEDVNPMIGVERNKISLDPDSSLAASSEPRRSSRNAQATQFSDSSIGVEGANPSIGAEPNKMLSDSDSSVEASLEPRRSSRNAQAKNKPQLKTTSPPRLSSRRKKQAVKQDAILFQATVSNYHRP
jgi:hypothetical protein